MFCSKCGKELPENAYFCPRCGVRTKRGVEAGISSPWIEELRDLFNKMGQEIEKAFSVAGKEMEKAFKTARGRIRESTMREQVCPHCGEKSQSNARFCYNCGKEVK